MLSYQIIGQGDVITFIHGFCEDLFIWKNAHKYFPNHSILSVDLPGFGKSKILDEQTIPNLAKAVLDLFKEQIISYRWTLIRWICRFGISKTKKIYRKVFDSVSL